MPRHAIRARRAWPVVLTDGRVGIRPISRRDAAEWSEVRRRNEAWLRPWEATVPGPGDGPPPTFAAMVRRLRADARAGRALPFVITYDGRLVGQLTVSAIVWGSARSAALGYWIDERVAGRGVTPTAVALAVDHCFSGLGLHRVEIAIRPENAASLRVVDKLGLREEGMRRGLLHIDGAWRDHRCFAVTHEEVAPEGLVARWQRMRRHEP
jgi:ribosomal-protein-alanine N-acetyltransferase